MYVYADRPDQYIINCSSTTGPRDETELGKLFRNHTTHDRVFTVVVERGGSEE